MHCLSTNYNEEPFNSATTHSLPSFPVSSPLFLLDGVVFTFHACWNSPPYAYGSEMHRYVARRPLARSRSCIACHEDRGGLHRRRRRRLDKLVCLSVSTHASMNTYGVDRGREGRKEGSGGQFCSSPKANDAKSVSEEQSAIIERSTLAPRPPWH